MRFLPRFILYVVLAALLTVGSMLSGAWSIHRAYQTGSEHYFEYGRLALDDGKWMMWQHQRIGLAEVVSVTQIDYTVEYVDTGDPPAWVPMDRARTDPRRDTPDLIRECAAQGLGWPMVGWIDWSVQSNFTLNPMTFKTTPIPPPPGIDMQRPYWPGLLGNLAFYTIIIAGLHTGFLVVRARRRTLRGLCPQCAYDLRGHAAAERDGADFGGCPECGAGSGVGWASPTCAAG